MEKLQRCLDEFHRARKNISSGIAYIGMKVYGFEISYLEVRNGFYTRGPYENRNLNASRDVSEIMAVAKEILEEARHRRAMVNDKCKTILTVATLLLGVAAFLLPRPVAFGSTFVLIAFVIYVLLLFLAIFLTLAFFDVENVWSISIDQAEIGLGKEDFAKSMINSYLSCQHDLDARTDFLVDLYATIRFVVISAICTLVTILCCLVLIVTSSS